MFEYVSSKKSGKLKERVTLPRSDISDDRNTEIDDKKIDYCKQNIIQGYFRWPVENSKLGLNDSHASFSQGMLYALNPTNRNDELIKGIMDRLPYDFPLDMNKKKITNYLTQENNPDLNGNTCKIIYQWACSNDFGQIETVKGILEVLKMRKKGKRNAAFTRQKNSMIDAHFASGNVKNKTPIFDISAVSASALRISDDFQFAVNDSVDEPKEVYMSENCYQETDVLINKNSQKSQNNIGKINLNKSDNNYISIKKLGITLYKVTPYFGFDNADIYYPDGLTHDCGQFAKGIVAGGVGMQTHTQTDGQRYIPGYDFQNINEEEKSNFMFKFLNYAEYLLDSIDKLSDDCVTEIKATAQYKALDDIAVMRGGSSEDRNNLINLKNNFIEVFDFISCLEPICIKHRQNYDKLKPNLLQQKFYREVLSYLYIPYEYIMNSQKILFTEQRANTTVGSVYSIHPLLNSLWNYHVACIVGKSDTDVITLENYVKGDQLRIFEAMLERDSDVRNHGDILKVLNEQLNKTWFFRMHGIENRTFFEEQFQTGAFGDAAYWELLTPQGQ